jgi:NAD(P)-dependent dehydrogenase (short-subunit alcohol dehydrogenase family)
MKDKLVLVTGANSGIGYATVKALATMGASVIMLCRDRMKGETAQRELIAATKNQRIHLVLADLAIRDDIVKACDHVAVEFGQLDVLVNNAALIPPKRTLTPDGLESQFAINHLSYFMMSLLLLPLLQKRGGRIVNVSSDLHREGVIDWDNLQAEREYAGSMYGSGWGQYSNTKLMNVLFTKALAAKLPDRAVTVNALHPGLIGTNLTRHNIPKLVRPFFLAFAPNADTGAKTSVYLASSPDVSGVTGEYFEKSAQITSSPASYKMDTAERLWQISAQISQLDPSLLSVAHSPS